MGPDTCQVAFCSHEEATVCQMTRCFFYTNTVYIHTLALESGHIIDSKEHKAVALTAEARDERWQRVREGATQPGRRNTSLPEVPLLTEAPPVRVRGQHLWNRLVKLQRLH